MIIRLTVKDNDFNDIMKGFIREFPLGITSLPNNISDLEMQESLKLLEKMNYIDRILLNPNKTEHCTEEDKAIIIEQIKKSFTEFVNTRISDYYAKYLINNFEVEIIKSMEDKWENGEVWYWFQHSGSFLNQ